MFNNKVIAITGAGSGIGRALALEFAARGARLALSDVSDATLAETITQLPAGVEARGYTVDVASREAVFRFPAASKPRSARSPPSPATQPITRSNWGRLSAAR